MPLLEAALGAAAFVLASWVWTQLALRALALSPATPHWRVVCLALSNLFLWTREPTEGDYFSGIVHPSKLSPAGRAAHWEPDGEPRPAKFASGGAGTVKECFIILISVCAKAWQILASCLRWADVTLLQPLEQSMAMLQASSQDAVDESCFLTATLSQKTSPATERVVQGERERTTLSSEENQDCESDHDGSDSPEEHGMTSSNPIQSEEPGPEAQVDDEIRRPPATSAMEAPDICQSNDGDLVGVDQYDIGDVSQFGHGHEVPTAVSVTSDPAGAIGLNSPSQKSLTSTEIACVDERASAELSSETTCVDERASAELSSQAEVDAEVEAKAAETNVLQLDKKDDLAINSELGQEAVSYDRNVTSHSPVRISRGAAPVAQVDVAPQRTKKTLRGSQPNAQKSVVVLCRGDKVIDAGNISIGGNSQNSGRALENVELRQQISLDSKSKLAESSSTKRPQERRQVESIAEALLQQREESHEDFFAMAGSNTGASSSPATSKSSQTGMSEGRSSSKASPSKMRSSVTWKPSLRFSGASPSISNSSAEQTSIDCENVATPTSSKSKASRTNVVRRSFYAAKESLPDD